MQSTPKIALVSAFVASISFAQSDASPPLGSTAQTVYQDTTGIQRFSGGDITASNFLFQRRIFASYPEQVSATTPRKTKPGPPMEGSQTGYIENAIVGNQIRLRFDAGFDFQDPDRAEFFYAKCGCYRNPALPANVYDPNAPGPGAGVAAKLNFQEVHLNVEYAPITRLSFFADVPERSIQFTPLAGSGGLTNASGFGDFEAGFKFALLASPERYLTFETGAFMPTGDSFRGLGTNHFSVQPMLLFNQKLAGRVTIAGQFGDWHPINGSAGIPTKTSPNGFPGDVLIYGLGGSYDFLSGSENHIAPVVEFVGWTVTGGFATNNVGNPTAQSGVNIINGKVGARFSFHTHNSIYVGFGHVLSHARWYEEMMRLEYRFTF